MRANMARGLGPERYVPAPSDLGFSLRVVVRASSFTPAGWWEGTTAATSAAATVEPGIAQPPTTTTRPTIPTTPTPTPTPPAHVYRDGSIQVWPWVSETQEYKRPIRVGDDVTFDVSVSNHGNVPLAGVNVLYRPPAGARVVKAPQCTIDAVVSCQLRTLPLLEVVSAQIVVRFTRPGTIKNAFLISQAQQDDDRTDDRAVVTIEVAPPTGVRRTGTARNNLMTGTRSRICFAASAATTSCAGSRATTGSTVGRAKLPSTVERGTTR